MAENGTAKKEDEPKVLFLSGEVHIVADAQTGNLSVKAPQNFIITLGLLEIAKVILVAQQEEKRKTGPEIKAPTPADVAALSQRN